MPFDNNPFDKAEIAENYTRTSNVQTFVVETSGIGLFQYYCFFSDFLSFGYQN